MTLNMKNYKGYDKKPYCNAHYPTTKFTAVVDTPESLRLAQNTKIQSQAEYHKDFDNSKYTFVPDNPDAERLKKNSQLNSNIEYRGIRKEHNDMEARRPSGADYRFSGYSEDPDTETISYASPYGARNSSISVAYTNEGRVESAPQRRIGSIADYDPMSNNFGSSGSREWQETMPEPTRKEPTKPAGAIGIQVLPTPGGSRGPQRQSSQPEQLQPARTQQPQQVLPPQQVIPPPQQVLPPSYASQQPARASVQQPQSQQQVGVGAAQPSLPSGRRNPLAGAVFQAMYDYVAADKDEVSFNENDMIVDVEPIDEGWMFGTVRRTGLRGMLPSNYVERVQ